MFISRRKREGVPEGMERVAASCEWCCWLNLVGAQMQGVMPPLGWETTKAWNSRQRAIRAVGVRGVL